MVAHALENEFVDYLQQKYGLSNDTQEGERVEEVLIRLNISSDSSSTEDPTPPSVGKKLGDLPPLPPKDGETFQRRLSSPPAHPLTTEPKELF